MNLKKRLFKLIITILFLEGIYLFAIPKALDFFVQTDYIKQHFEQKTNASIKYNDISFKTHLKPAISVKIGKLEIVDKNDNSLFLNIKNGDITLKLLPLITKNIAIENVSSIEEKEEPSKDIPDLPDFSAIEEKPIIKEEPVKEESIYKNDKKLSDIFKKKTVSEEPKLEKTEDYSNELDKILKKLNEASSTKDSTLEETTDFTNMLKNRRNLQVPVVRVIIPNNRQ